MALSSGGMHGGECGEANPGSTPIGEALRLERQGEGARAISRLLDLAPETRGEARLELEIALGNLLVKYRRPEEAAAHLEAAAAENWQLRPYARILLARVLAEIGRQPERIRDLASNVAAGDELSLLADEALWLLVRAAIIEEEPQAVVAAAGAYLEIQPEGRWVEDANWNLAEAHTRAGNHRGAYDVYDEIWYGTPSSAYALEALKKMGELRERFAYPARTLSSRGRYEFIRSLRRAGRHREALDEIATFKSQHPEHSRGDSVLFLEAISAYEVRRNAQSIQAAETLMYRYPGSQWVAPASIYAIKSLRRGDDTAEVRRWCNRVIADHAGSDEAYEAMYNLATYMANVGLTTGSPDLLDESHATFKRLTEEGGERGIVEDALWKYAWFEIRTGERQAACETLERLLDRFAGTGYRAAALFWIGKLSLEAGRRERSAASWLKVVEEEPYGYYGHRSLEMLSRIGVKPDTVGSDLRFPPIDRLEEPRGAHHYDIAVRLKQVGLYEFAADELAVEAIGRDEPGRQFALADLRAAAGRGTRALKDIRDLFREYVDAGGRNIPEDFWRIVYPLHHWALISEEARKYGVDPWLAVVLIRNESLFYANATSPAGAVGLMQLMPETAITIAEELGMAAPTGADLYDPGLNIHLGMYYLNKRIEDFGGDFVRALCSYNAGVEPVRRWTEQNKADDTDEWIELIPYTETRLYIKAILRDLREYRRLYG